MTPPPVLRGGLPATPLRQDEQAPAGRCLGPRPRDTAEEAAAPHSLIWSDRSKAVFTKAQPADPKLFLDCRFGVTITDACISWETTERMLRWGYEMLDQAPQGNGSRPLS